MNKAPFVEGALSDEAAVHAVYVGEPTADLEVSAQTSAEHRPKV